jgi:hypothetical protein
MSTRNCVRCGRAVPSDVAFCPFCGAKLNHPLWHANTHSYGWVLMSFLVSFLWFKMSDTPVFPVGFVGGLVITFWSSDIDKAVGKEPLTWLSVAISMFGMILGFLIR